MTPFRTISWGCGVQSTALAVMSALGDLEPVDVVITADTGWEQQRTYEIREFYAKWLRDRGQQVEIIAGGDIRQAGALAHIHIPFWTSDGGPLQRQCTREFKIRPIRRRVREVLGFHPTRPPHPKPGSIEMWIGISLDEYTRIKDSRVKFIRHRWPLIEKRLTRNHCLDYLAKHGLPTPISSACVCCPYRSASNWLEMKANAPDEFAAAIAFDEAIRHNPLADRGGSSSDELYLYKHAMPLAAADLVADAARERRGKQLPLCLDICFT